MKMLKEKRPEDPHHEIPDLLSGNSVKILLKDFESQGVIR